jgi:hypothetical protein
LIRLLSQLGCDITPDILFHSWHSELHTALNRIQAEQLVRLSDPSALPDQYRWIAAASMSRMFTNQLVAAAFAAAIMLAAVQASTISMPAAQGAKVDWSWRRYLGCSAVLASQQWPCHADVPSACEQHVSEVHLSSRGTLATAV